MIKLPKHKTPGYKYIGFWNYNKDALNTDYAFNIWHDKYNENTDATCGKLMGNGKCDTCGEKAPEGLRSLIILERKMKKI